MARSQRKYDHEYKVQAVKLAKEIGGAKAAKELGIPEGTIHTWLKAVRTGQLDIGEGAHTPESAMSLAEELTMLRKRVKDITEIKAKDGKLYVSAIFDCFDSAVLGLAMETTMKATLCQHTVENAFIAYPEIQGAVLHSDRGSQYTSELYRSTLRKYEIIQSMNSAGGRCHDNARCESMWARLKTELLYDRYNSENLTVSELKSLIWRYFISYWNNRRICTTNGGLPPMLKRQRYYDSLRIAA